MKKIIKLFAGLIALVLFFFLIDDSGVDMKGKFEKVKEWAVRNKKKLKE